MNRIFIKIIHRNLTFLGSVMGQAVNHVYLTTEPRLRYQVSPREISGGQSGTGSGFPPSTSVFPLSESFH
jgi:hypothetical protein